MAHHLRIANAGVIRRDVGDWAETETARDILRSLDLVKASKKPALTMIAGVPGSGKTTAVKQFCDAQGHDAIYIQAARGEGTAWNFAKSLASLWGPSAPHFSCHAEARQNLAFMIGKRRILIIDEAQYLDQKNHNSRQNGEAFEWVRATAEQGEFHVVFCGDLNLPRAIGKMPQLQSRMMRPVEIKQVSRADVAVFMEGTPFTHPAALDALHAIARLHGGMRNVENVTRIAQLFAGDGAPTLAHIKAAIVDMKLAPKGEL